MIISWSNLCIVFIKKVYDWALLGVFSRNCKNLLESWYISRSFCGFDGLRLETRGAAL